MNGGPAGPQTGAKATVAMSQVPKAVRSLVNHCDGDPLRRPNVSKMSSVTVASGVAAMRAC